MKKIISIVTIALMMTFTFLATGSVEAYSAELTVSGSVASGTNESLLKLSTSGGIMEIKLDSNTQYACKTILPGTQITAELNRGSDAYWHAAKLSGDNKVSAVTLDTSNPQYVNGYIKKLDDDIMYFETPQGEMHIKLDSATDISEISVLVCEKYYRLEIVRGSDAYMHTTKIFNSTQQSASYSSGGSYTYSKPSGVEDPSVTVTGKVSDKTTVDMLYLSTDQGEMQIKLDSVQGKAVLISGKKVSITIGYGKDGYWHGFVVTNK